MWLDRSGMVTVWDVDPKEKYTNAKVSTSTKNPDGEYETDFSDIIRFVKDAHTKAKSLSPRDKIYLKGIILTNRYDKETKRKFTNITATDFDVVFGNRGKQEQEKPVEQKEPEKQTEESSELPF